MTDDKTGPAKATVLFRLIAGGVLESNTVSQNWRDSHFSALNFDPPSIAGI
jgi:hypothetical protein